MNIFHLPQDIFPGKKIKPAGITIHYYTAPMGAFRGKSILHTNAISLVISGRKSMHFANETVHVNPDEFHFLSSGNCMVQMELTKTKTFSSILVFFDTKTLDDFYLKYAAKIDRIRGKQKITRRLYVAVKKDEFVRNFIDSLCFQLKTGKELSVEMKALKFEELMLHLLEENPLAVLSFQTSERKELDDFEIRKAVEVNMIRAISLEELAFLCNTSLSTFKRRFAKLYGMPPSKWLLQKRMEMARDLLTHYGEKPSEVYHKVGYENHSSFTQSFKQTYGLTPRDFQRRQLTV